MSYDVSIETPGEAEVFWRNYTSNTSWMWTECLALPEKPWIRDGEQVIGSRINRDTGGWERTPMFNRGLRLLDGAPCSEAAGVLAAAVERMRAKADDYRGREPENGWGTYDGALLFLTEIAQAASDHPTGTIRVSS